MGLSERPNLKSYFFLLMSFSFRAVQRGLGTAQVMALVTAGKLNKVVGEELGITEITVKAHRGSLMRKMAAGFLADLVRVSFDIRSAIERKGPLSKSTNFSHDMVNFGASGFARSGPIRQQQNSGADRL
jgi:hypothetical protein